MAFIRIEVILPAILFKKFGLPQDIICRIIFALKRGRQKRKRVFFRKNGIKAMKAQTSIPEHVASACLLYTSAPGQFVNIKLDGLFLRRPISVCDYDKDSLTLIYKVVGVGTEKMAGLSPGDKLDILVGLGNGYDMSVPFDKPLLIGGEMCIRDRLYGQKI